MDPLSFALTVGALVNSTAKVVEYLHDVREGGKQRLRLSAEVSALWMVLENIQGQLDNNDGDPNRITTHYLEVLNKSDGVLTHCSDIVGVLERKLRPRQGVKGVVQQLRWPFERDEVMTYLETVHSMQATINLAYAQATLKLLESVAKDTGEIRTRVQQQELQSLLDWLSSINFEDHHQRIRSQVCAGTGDWFLKVDEYHLWVEGRMSYLWCPGSQPGSGKTTLMSIVIDDLRARKKSPASAVLGVYLQSLVAEQCPLNISTVMGTLLKQAILISSDVPQYIWDWYHSNIRITNKYNSSDLKSYLDKVLCQFDRVYLVLDAVEVVSPGGDRLALIKFLQALSDHVSILITYQGQAVIAQDVAPLAHVCDICSSNCEQYLYHCNLHARGGFDVCTSCFGNGSTQCEDEMHGPMILLRNASKMAIQAHRTDLSRYIAMRINHAQGILSSSRVDNQLKFQIHNSVLHRATSTFLYAKMYLDHLETLDTIRDLKEALVDFPKDINETYAQAVGLINRQRPQIRQLAKQVLKWVMSARRPLHTTEIEHAVQIKPDSGEIELYDVVPAQKLAAICNGLVVINHANFFRIVHHTAKGFLDPIIDESFPEADFEIAAACMTYLSSALSSSSESGHAISIPNLQTDKYPFVMYAASFWAVHLGPLPDERLLQSSLDLLTNNSHAHVIGTFYKLEASQKSEATKDPGISLRIAAHFGLTAVIQSLLNLSEILSEIDSFDLYGRTALWTSVAQGHSQITQILLTAGASPNLADMYGTTPILAAIKEDRLETLRQLLNTRSCDVNQRLRIVTREVTPLIFAASRGKLESVRVLLTKAGLQINQIVGGSTALTAALKTGHLDCVEVLLQDKRCDVDAGVENDQTPLHYTVMTGNEAAVKILIQYGANIDCRDINGHTPIFSALIENQVAIAKYLVVKGANTTVVNASGQNILHLAAQYQSSDIIDTVLTQNKPVDINAQDQMGETPLHVAVWFNSLESSLALLGHGADSNIENNSGMTAYEIAQEYGRELILQALDERSQPFPISASKLESQSTSNVDEVEEKLKNL